MSEKRSEYRVGIWAAVSSEQQATDDKESLDAQVAAGERFFIHRHL